MNKNFSTSFQYLNSFKNIELFINEQFCELPFLKSIFERLQSYAQFKRQRFIIDSVYSPGTEVFIKHGLQDSIVFYLSNEHHQLPPYYEQVKHIFTPYLPYQNIPQNAHSIPLGCNGEISLIDYIPWQNRTNDIFFSGQYIDGLDYRERFRHNMEDLKFKIDSQGLPWKYHLEFTPKFRAGMSPQNYMLTMMNSKIALVPRGYSQITYRLFEAAYCGTIIIGENYLAPSYMDEFPWLRVNHWGDLNQFVFHLMQQPELMHSLHQDTLKAQRQFLTPEAVSKRILAVLGWHPLT